MVAIGLDCYCDKYLVRSSLVYFSLLSYDYLYVISDCSWLSCVDVCVNLVVSEDISL